MVPGVRVHGPEVVDVEVALDDQFRQVPVPCRLGVPLVFKKMPGTGGDDSHIRSNVIVRFMADPDDGFAPPAWQYGGRVGPAPPVVLARRDGLPFSKQDWQALDEYIEEWLGECAEEEEDRCAVGERLLTPEAFQAFVRKQGEEHPTAFLPLQFPLHSTVMAEGLSATELNGKEGQVVQYSRDRVGVQYPDRGVTALKPERLKLLREPPKQVEPDSKRQDTGVAKEAKQARQREVEKQEALAISKRFIECLHQDTFPEMGDLHLFGVGCDYHSRAQEVLGVWQGAAKKGSLTAEQLAEALEKGATKELFMETCRSLADSRTPNSTYANELIRNNFAALEWDTL